jgi:thioredoxin 1
MRKNVTSFNGSLEDLNKAIVAAGYIVVLDFEAGWCPACRRLNQLFGNIAQENPKVTFFKIDIDANTEIRDHFVANQLPALHFFRVDGEDVEDVGVLKGLKVPEFRNLLTTLQQ